MVKTGDFRLHSEENTKKIKLYFGNLQCMNFTFIDHPIHIFNLPVSVE